MTHADPELSCMYPMRDWVTCVDACVILFINLGPTQNSCQLSRKRSWMVIMNYKLIDLQFK